MFHIFESEMATQQEKQYPVFLIYSQWSIQNLKEFIQKSMRTPNARIGDIHIDRDRSGNETNRTVTLMDENIYEALIEQGYGRRNFNYDFSIARYNLKPYHYPPANYTYNFYIPLPKDEPGITGTKVKQFLNSRLKIFSEFGLIPSNSYSIVVPLVSRETDEPRGTCFVMFNRAQEDPSGVVLAKVLLDNTLWFDDGTLLKCFWAFKRPQQQPQFVVHSVAELMKQGQEITNTLCHQPDQEKVMVDDVERQAYEAIYQARFIPNNRMSPAELDKLKTLLGKRGEEAYAVSLIPKLDD